MELDGKVALVTGASGGIGAAVARRLHEAGASVGLLSRHGDDLGLERGLGLACDVRDRAAVADATEAVVERFGRLDMVVANAGVGAYGPFLELDPEQVEAMIDINLKGTLYTAAATLPHLIDSRRGGLHLTGERRRSPGVSGRVRLQRVEVRPARVHALARPRAARTGGARHLHLPGRREHRTSRSGPGATEGDPELEGMLTADEVADVVLFTVTRPRRMRILTTSFRPMIEASWG